MSFGFSAGDIISVGKLITSVVACLREVGGSASEYRLLVQELEYLDATLRLLDGLESRSGDARGSSHKKQSDYDHDEGGSSLYSSSSLESIRCAALSCRHPLEQFLGGMKKKYGRSLADAGGDGDDDDDDGSGGGGFLASRNRRVRVAVDKMRFACRRDDIRQFQSYLSVHIGTINMMLAEHGFQRMDRLASDMARNELEREAIVKEKIAEAREVSSNMQDGLFSQIGAIFNAQAVMNRLLRMMSYDVRSTLSSIETTVAKLWIYTQQIHEILLEIRARMSVPPDSKWSAFKEPVLFEDALGRILPVPSEYDLDLLKAVIGQRFANGPGSVEVRHGDYELFDTRHSRLALPSGTEFQPGSSITMAILIPQSQGFAKATTHCPMPGCFSAMVTPGRWNTGLVCSECNTCFDRTNKRLKYPMEVGMISSSHVEYCRNEDMRKALCVIESLPHELSAWSSIRRTSSIFKNVRYSNDIAAPWAWGNMRSQIKIATRTLMATPHKQMEQEPAEDTGLSEAMIFLNVLRAALVQCPLVYIQFLDTLELFDYGSLNAAQAIGRMRVLFHDTPSLSSGFLRLLLYKCGIRDPSPPNIAKVDPTLASNGMVELIKDMEDGIIARFQELMPLWDLITQQTRLRDTDVDRFPSRHLTRTEYELSCVQEVVKLAVKLGPLYQQHQRIWENYCEGTLSKHGFFQQVERALTKHTEVTKALAQGMYSHDETSMADTTCTF